MISKNSLAVRGSSTLLFLVVLVSSACSSIPRGDDQIGGISLRDRAAISDLLSRYSAAYDSNNTDAYANLFTVDAVITVQGERIVGRDAIHAWAERGRKRRGPNTIVRHYQTNTLLSPIDEDRVRARSMLMLTYQDKAGSLGTAAKVMATGIYLDELHRTADGWRFFRRSADADLELDPAFLRE